MQERRKKTFFQIPLINTVVSGLVVAIVLIPVNLAAINFTKIASSPEQIQKINYEVKSISDDIELLKCKLDKNDVNMLRLEKAVTRLEALIERIN